MTCKFGPFFYVQDGRYATDGTQSEAGARPEGGAKRQRWRCLELKNPYLGK